MEYRIGLIYKILIVCVLTISMCSVSTNAFSKKKKDLEGVININTASEKKLLMLPGIGKTQAKNIVSFRNKISFKKPSDIKKVDGIGNKTFEKIKKYLVVKGKTTLKKN